MVMTIMIIMITIAKQNRKPNCLLGFTTVSLFIANNEFLKENELFQTFAG